MGSCTYIINRAYRRRKCYRSTEYIWIEGFQTPRILMNWPLLYFIAPLALVLLLSDFWLAKVVLRMRAIPRRDVWGGLHGGWWYLWCVTFFLSSIGTLQTFGWFFFYSDAPTGWNPGSGIIVIFLVMNTSLICYSIALARQSKTGVCLTLTLAVSSYIIMFIYTLQVFPSQEGYAPALHLGNAIVVFHGLVLDYCVWQPTWFKSVTSYYPCVDLEFCANELTPQDSSVEESN